MEDWCLIGKERRCWVGKYEIPAGDTHVGLWQQYKRQILWYLKERSAKGWAVGLFWITTVIHRLPLERVADLVGSIPCCPLGPVLKSPEISQCGLASLLVFILCSQGFCLYWCEHFLSKSEKCMNARTALLPQPFAFWSSQKVRLREKRRTEYDRIP